MKVLKRQWQQYQEWMSSYCYGAFFEPEHHRLPLWRIKVEALTDLVRALYRRHVVCRILGHDWEVWDSGGPESGPIIHHQCRRCYGV